MKWRYARNSHQEASILFSTESERHRLTESLNSLKASPATKAENSLSMVGKMKNIAVWSSSSSSSRVSLITSSWNRCIHGYRCLYRRAEGEQKPQREVETRRYSRISCYSENKTSKVVYLKSRIQWILFCGKLKNWDWTLLRDTPEILRMHLVQDWTRKRQIQSGGIIPKRWTSWAKSLRAWFWGTTIVSKPHDKQILPAK